MPTPYYEQDGITIYQGRTEDILPTIEAGSVGLILSDPPYGKTQNEWDVLPDWPWLWSEYRRVTAPNAAMLMFGQDDFTAEMICSNRRDYRYSLVWEHDRTSGFLNAARQPLRSHQDIALFARAQPHYSPLTWQGEPQHGRGRPSRKQSANYGAYENLGGQPGNTEKLPRTVLYFPKPHPCVHPNEKSVALLEYLIRTYSQPGDLVLDSYAGSGPIVAAAARSGRRCIAIEGKSEYCEKAVGRLRQAVLSMEGAA
jgi:site-specific DNA-methyltransferase (adenine-specific)